jgi:WD40 repeat protein
MSSSSSDKTDAIQDNKSNAPDECNDLRTGLLEQSIFGKLPHELIYLIKKKSRFWGKLKKFVTLPQGEVNFSLAMNDSLFAINDRANPNNILAINTDSAVISFEGHTGQVTNFVMLSKMLVSSSTDQTLRVWNEEGKCVDTIIVNRIILELTALRCGKRVCFRTIDDNVIVWNVETGICEHVTVVRDPILHIIATGEHVIVVGEGYRLVVISVATGDWFTIDTPILSPLSVRIFPGGVFAISNRLKKRVMRVNFTVPSSEQLTPHEANLYHNAFATLTGGRIATVNKCGTFNIFDITTQKLLAKFRVGGRIWDIKALVDGSLAIVVGRSVIVYDTVTGKLIHECTGDGTITLKDGMAIFNGANLSVYK